MFVVVKPDKRRTFILKSQIYTSAINSSGLVSDRAFRLSGCFQLQNSNTAFQWTPHFSGKALLLLAFSNFHE